MGSFWRNLISALCLTFLCNPAPAWAAHQTSPLFSTEESEFIKNFAALIDAHAASAKKDDSVWSGFDLHERPILFKLPNERFVVFNLKNPNRQHWQACTIDGQPLLANGRAVYQSSKDYWGLKPYHMIIDFFIDGEFAFVFAVSQFNSIYLSVIVHEFTHCYQHFSFAALPPASVSNFFAALDPELIELMILEDELTIDYLQAPKHIETMRDFLAVVAARRKQTFNPAALKYEDQMHRSEGVADYVTAAILERYPEQAMEYDPATHDESEKAKRQMLPMIQWAAFWRHYNLGKALGLALDNLQISDWQQRLAKGEIQLAPVAVEAIKWETDYQASGQDEITWRLQRLREEYASMLPSQDEIANAIDENQQLDDDIQAIFRGEPGVKIRLNLSDTMRRSQSWQPDMISVVHEGKSMMVPPIFFMEDGVLMNTSITGTLDSFIKNQEMVQTLVLNYHKTRFVFFSEEDFIPEHRLTKIPGSTEVVIQTEKGTTTTSVEQLVQQKKGVPRAIALTLGKVGDPLYGQFTNSKVSLTPTLDGALQIDFVPLDLLLTPTLDTPEAQAMFKRLGLTAEKVALLTEAAVILQAMRQTLPEPARARLALKKSEVGVDLLLVHPENPKLLTIIRGRRRISLSLPRQVQKLEERLVTLFRQRQVPAVIITGVDYPWTKLDDPIGEPMLPIATIHIPQQR